MNKPTLIIRAALLLVLAAINPRLSTVLAQDTAFTYQGQLWDGGSPATGSYDLKLTLFDAVTNGNSVAGPVTNTAVGVTNGLFTTVIDFGSAFDGNLDWLRLQVRTNGGGAFTTLSPRQQLTPTPYAEFATTASNVSGTISFAQLPSGLVTNEESALTLTGSFFGNGAGLTNLNAAMLNGLSAGSFWQLGGNNVTGGEFIGSTNNQPIEIWAASQRAFRVEPDTTGSGSPNVIGGSVGNFMNAGGVIGGFIGGGGATNYNGASYPNHVAAYYGSVVGGYGNTIVAFANAAFIGGGDNNSVAGNSAVISGGEYNRIKASADHGVIDGGIYNTNGGEFGVIGGGQNDTVTANNANVAGGYANTASGQYSAVAGGSQNTASAVNSAVGGGGLNTAGGASATVGGGAANTAGGTSATVGGGTFNSASGIYSTVGGGSFNAATLDYATVSGGESNVADGTDAVVGGGNANLANGIYSTVAGGQTNSAVAANAAVGGGRGNQALAPFSTIAGGGFNQASDFSFVGGGYYIWAFDFSVVGGGNGNWASNYSVVGGGDSNIATGEQSAIGGGGANQAMGTSSTVSGGDENLSTGEGATVPGGEANVAMGMDSFAAGLSATAQYDHSFVWSDGSGDGSDLFFEDTGPNQFLIQATGGVGINMNTPTGDSLSIGGSMRMNNNVIYLRAGSDQNHGLRYVGNGTTFGGISPDGPVLFGYSGGALGTDQNGTTHVALQWTTSSVTVSGTFNNNSDRNAKENFSNVRAAHILEKVAQLPLCEWSYKTDSATRHIGPMAQDFYAAFNVGTDEKHIAPIDEGGVALAAIQGLNQKLEELKTDLKHKDAENVELKQRLAALERIILGQKQN
ncbi:MAG: tail fiber domain-containing protein [Verrucomicrobiota bacterium]|jgi:hypothetical protein